MVSDSDLAGIGTGYHVARFYTGSISAEECLRSIELEQTGGPASEHGKLARLIKDADGSGGGPVLFPLFDRDAAAVICREAELHARVSVLTWNFDYNDVVAGVLFS